MECPRCGRPVPEGSAVCDTCGAPLGGAADGGPSDLVTVLETGDPALLAVAESLLEAEGISCHAQGEGVQEFVGLGRIGLGENLAAGLVRLQVAPEDADAARALLAARGEFPEMPEGD
uniref:Zinc ribbon domain-containing protein n=1 Tax=Eiseniibacteriota bacterium TaxID=2212470 RepID=A0A832I099_UNCEI